MFYVNIDPTEAGYHGNPQSQNLGGMIELPEKFIHTYIASRGFVDLTIENGKVIDVQPNQANLGTYIETHPDRPKRKPVPDQLDELHAQIASLTAQNELYEELIVELAGVVYA